MENQSLTEIIQESMAATEPETVNQEAPEVQDESDDVTIDDLISDLVEDEDADSDTPDEGEGEEGDEDPSLAETYQVKVDGEVVEVSLKEALAGYQRQADYTRKAQALAAEKEQLIEAAQEFEETLGSLQQLDSAWEENPIQVIAHFTANTENPTQAVALLIKELASNNMLDQEFLDMFGITNEVRSAWSKESEVDGLRRKVSRAEEAELSKRQQEQYEVEVEKAMAEYEVQIDKIVADEGLKLNSAQRNAFRTRLAQYAFDNELTNLTAAYKALKYEETQKKKEVVRKTAERTKQKKAASVVGRSGSGADGAKPITDSSDLQAIIRAAMDEQSSR